MSLERLHPGTPEDEEGVEEQFPASSVPERRFGSMDMTPGQKLRMRKLGHKEFLLAQAARRREKIDALREYLKREAQESGTEAREWTDEELYGMLQEKEEE